MIGPQKTGLRPGCLVLVKPDNLVGDVLRIGMPGLGTSRPGKGFALIGLLKHEVPGSFYPGWSIERKVWWPEQHLEQLDPTCFVAAAHDRYGKAGYP